MSSTEQKPQFSWEETKGMLEEAEDDFLQGVEGQEAPKACSLDDNSCDACQ
jgi:hypothetical protein